MTTWVIISWVFVALFTGLNIFLFLKLKKASDQMMKMAFPNAKNMGDAMSQMQSMLAGMGGRGMPGRGGMPGGAQANAQMKMAMDLLQQMQKGGKPRR